MLRIFISLSTKTRLTILYILPIPGYLTSSVLISIYRDLKKPYIRYICTKLLGEEIKYQDLPLIMATEAKEYWADYNKRSS